MDLVKAEIHVATFRAVVSARSLAEGYFHVQWEAALGRPGVERITGYVFNDYAEEAQGVELGITGLDCPGKPAGSTIAPVADTAPGGGRTSFDLRLPQRVASRVGV